MKCMAAHRLYITIITFFKCTLETSNGYSGHLNGATPYGMTNGVTKSYTSSSCFQDCKSAQQKL